MNLRNHVHPSPRLAAGLSLMALVALSACGGGGGETAVPAPPTGSTGTPTVTVAGIVPGASMTWTTQQEQVLDVAVRTPEGGPAVGAAVRVFMSTRDDPHGGAALEVPVPVSLMDTAVADANGQVRLVRAWPAHLGEVLVVATGDDASAQAAVRLGSASLTTLQLAR